MADTELVISVIAAAVGAGTIAFELVRGAFAAQGENGGSGVKALLAIPAAFIARRRVNDIELSNRLDTIERLRIQAGGRFLDGATAAEIFAAKYVFPVFGFLGALGISALLQLSGFIAFLIGIAFAVMLFLWPESALKEAANKRTSKFVTDLPMVLDVMRLVCQAGGDLYSAIRSAIGVTPESPVREELVRAVNEVAIGSSLAAALNHVGERISTAEANAVFSTLSQSLEMGTSVAENLQSASSLIRKAQRVRAQARAQKAVVMMTFPLLLLILPGVFIVLFAPMIIQYASH